MQDHNVKQLGRISMYANFMRSVSGDACRARDSAGSNPRLCLKKKEFFTECVNNRRGDNSRKIAMKNINCALITMYKQLK